MKKNFKKRYENTELKGVVMSKENSKSRTNKIKNGDLMKKNNSEIKNSVLTGESMKKNISENKAIKEKGTFDKVDEKLWSLNNVLTKILKISLTLRNIIEMAPKIYVNILKIVDKLSYIISFLP